MLSPSVMRDLQAIRALCITIGVTAVSTVEFLVQNEIILNFSCTN